MLEFRKKNQYAAFWQQLTRISAEIVQKRAEKLMENDKVKTLINSSFKQLTEISEYKIEDPSSAYVKSLNILKQKTKF